MRSLLKVLKPGYMSEPEGIVEIPDAPSYAPQDVIVDDASAECPGQEVISPEEIYQSMIQRAKEDIEKMSEKLTRIARMERESLLRQAAEDAHDIREKAYREAFQEARESKTGEIEAMLNNVAAVLKQLQTQHRQYMAEYEKELKSFALEIASQIMHKRIMEQGDDMEELVMHAMNSVKGVDWITVQISDQLPQLYSALEKELKDYHNAKTVVEIETKDLPADSCYLQTPGGIIDASIDTQLANLKEYFEQID